jgi:hypothetical protein
MIGHQDVRMELTVLALQGVAQPAKVGVAILVIEEAGPAIVATLHDVQRYTVDVDARTPEHEGSLAQIEPGPSRPTKVLRASRITKHINGLAPISPWRNVSQARSP